MHKCVCVCMHTAIGRYMCLLSVCVSMALIFHFSLPLFRTQPLPVPWLVGPWPWLYLSTAMVTLPCAHEFIICPCVDIVGWLMSCFLSSYTTHSKPHHHLHPLRSPPRKATTVLFPGLSREIIVLLEKYD